MYSFESKPRKGMLHVLTGGCFITAFILLGLSGLDGMSYPVIYQLTAFGLLTAGVYLMIRYILRLYRYELEESGISDRLGQRQYDLVIKEVAGRKIRVVARMLVRDITAVAVIDAKKDKAREQAFVGDIKKVYRYINDPFEKRGLYLLLPEEDSVVVIPEDEQMMQYLQSLSE